MTEKEKAKELVDKYKQIGNYIMPLYSQKICALIAVDEKEETLLDVIGTQPQMWTSHEKSLVDDLEQVRKEIESL